MNFWPRTGLSILNLLTIALDMNPIKTFTAQKASSWPIN